MRFVGFGRVVVCASCGLAYVPNDGPLLGLR